MDRFTRWTIITLVIQVLVLSVTVSHLCYKLGYEQGRASIFQECADGPDVGTMYAPKGSHHVKR